MPSKTFKASISADGKVLHSLPLANLKPGDKLFLTIDGKKIIGGVEAPTLLGDPPVLLPCSYELKLRDIKKLADGKCRLAYDVL